jgi:hypothetical protein
MSGSKVLRSNGGNEERAYAVLALPPTCPEPTGEAERVQIVDPRHTSTVRSGDARPGSGPRNLDQKTWPPPKPPGIELPDGLPATKQQRIYIDPALVAEWREEARMREGGT